jgi:hypothetical protein
MKIDVKYHSKVVVKNFVTINGTTFRAHFHCGGYIYLQIPGDGDKPPITTGLHRYLMELHLGRKLGSDEHVHHKDGDKQNNAIENLEVILGSEHNSMHTRIRNLKHNPETFVCRECEDPSKAHKARGLCETCFARLRRREKAIRPCGICRRETKGRNRYNGMCHGCACKSWSFCKLCLRKKGELPKSPPVISPDGLCRACNSRLQRLEVELNKTNVPATSPPEVVTASL